MCSAKRILSMTPMLALLVAVALPAAAQSEALTPAAANQVQGGLEDPRWLPWLGCWELTADAVDYRQVEDTGRRIVCVAPRLDGIGVNLTTRLDEEIIAQNTVIADGRARALPEDDCSGEQTASWSANGRRLHSVVSASCAADASRSLLGFNMLAEGQRWIELQSVSFDGGEHRELVIRHYQRLGNAETAALGVETLAPALAVQAATARAGAAGPLTVDDVLETSKIFPVEIVEAAILESESAFALDSGALLRLADAGVEEQVIDLMVAISFPERFVVDSGRSGGGGGGGSTYVGFGGYMGYYPSCWGRYYSPFWGPYGPGCDPLFYSPYYGSYRPPYYYPGGGGNIGIKVPPSGSLYGGKVINNRGYATVRARPEPFGSTNDGVGGSLRRAFSRNGGSNRGSNGVFGQRAGSGSSSGGGSSRSAVTKSGFSKPGGGASGGSSGSGGAKVKAKAKPKVGGGGN